MKDDKTAKPETAVLPDFPWMNLRRVCLWPLRTQEMLWREARLTISAMAGLWAGCLRDMAHRSLPPDAVACRQEYARKRRDMAGTNGNRMALAISDGMPALRKAA